MKILKRFICVFMAVLILFFTVNNSYFSLHKMDYVEAASSGTNELTYKMMYYICFYVGSVAWSYFCTGESPNVSKDDIAEFGHKVIQEAVAPPYEGELLLDDDPVVGMVAPSRQPYVYGRKSLDDIANTLWVVIMNEVNEPDDDDEDEDKKDDNDKEEQPTSNPEEKPTTETDPKIKEQVKLDFTVSADNVTSTFWMMSALGANVIAQGISRLYDKYLDSDIEDDPITEMMQKCNNEGFVGYIYENGLYYYSLSFYSNNLLFCLNSKSTPYSAKCYAVMTDNVIEFYQWYQGKSSSKNIGLDCFQNGEKFFSQSCGFIDLSQVSDFGCNYPIFDSIETAEEAMLLVDYSSALNYCKSYKIADWLQDDWAGDLIDPLTGLNTAGDWFNLARHDGLNKIFSNGVNAGSDVATNYLRDYFGNLKEDNGLEYDPVTNPLPNPICYPANMPDPVINPSSSVALNPGERPGENPDTNPGTNPEPVTPVEPAPLPDNTEDLEEDLNNVVDYVPTLADSLTDMGDVLKKKFPFSIPWDIHYILSGLATTPKAPRFELPLKVERYGIDETIVVDMARFQVLSDLSRSIFSLLFALALINLTIKVIGSLKEE